MKCLSCDKILTDREATRKYTNFREMPKNVSPFIDLCDRCLGSSEVTYVDSNITDNEELVDDSETDASSETTI